MSEIKYPPILQELQKTTKDALSETLDFTKDDLINLMYKRAQLGYRFLSLDTELKIRADLVEELLAWGLMVSEYPNSTEIVWGTSDTLDNDIFPNTQMFIDSQLRPIYQSVFPTPNDDVGSEIIPQINFKKSR